MQLSAIKDVEGFYFQKAFVNRHSEEKKNIRELLERALIPSPERQRSNYN